MTENKKYEIGTLGWLREQQKTKAKKDGFDNVDNWLKWKADPFNILERKYGKEFADWARQNKDRVRQCVIDAGCNTVTEYNNKKARDAGFKNQNERRKEWRYNTGINLPEEFNEDCSLWFGEFISQNYVMNTFEDPIKMPPGNPGFDWMCKKGQKIDHKGACLQYLGDKSPYFLFHINYNNIADYFILSAWDNRDSLIPLHVWIFHKNDTVRGRKFWRRESFSISDILKGLKKFEDHEVTDRLDKLKELCDKDTNI